MQDQLFRKLCAYITYKIKKSLNVEANNKVFMDIHLPTPEFSNSKCQKGSGHHKVGNLT